MQTPAGNHARLLVVDDQEDVRSLLATALELEGFEVVGARDARDGLRCLADAEFDLIVTDYAMPGGTGLWMLHEAERRGLLDGIPALIVTAHPDLREGGEFEIMRKPLDLERFLAQVRTLLEQRGRSDGGQRELDPGREGAEVELVLYVSSSSFASRQARRNLKAVLAEFDASRLRVAVHDLSRDALGGEEDGIHLTPTLVKRKPAPKLWIIGSLHDRELLAGVLEGAGLEPRRGPD